MSDQSYAEKGITNLDLSSIPGLIIGPGVIKYPFTSVLGLATTINNGVTVSIPFFGLIASTPPAIWSAVNPSRFTAPLAGKYLFNFSINTNPTDAQVNSNVAMTYAVNGAFALESSTTQASVITTARNYQKTFIVTLAAGDYLEIRLTNNSGVAIHTVSNETLAQVCYLGSV